MGLVELVPPGGWIFVDWGQPGFLLAAHLASILQFDFEQAGGADLV
jgi:hypothetical protein